MRFETAISLGLALSSVSALPSGEHHPKGVNDCGPGPAHEQDWDVVIVGELGNL